jgi:hypothetical protein
MSTGDEPLGPDERAQLDQLRDEVARLRENQSQSDASPTVAMPARSGRWARGGRWSAVTVLVVIIALLAPVTVLARYVRAQLLDTDRYVATVSPLASDPVVQDALAARITDTIFSYLDVQGLAQQGLDKLAELGLPSQVTGLAEPISNAVEQFVGDKVNQLVHSQTFEDLWIQANRTAHEQMVSALTGEGTASISIKNGQVSVNVAPVIQTLKQELVDSGFRLASRIPDVEATFVILQSKDLATAQTSVRALDKLANILPFALLVLIAITLLIAPGRRRALVMIFAGVAVATAIFAIGILIARWWYLENLPSAIHSKAAATSIVDALLHPLRVSLRAVILASAIIAVGAWIAGPSPGAVATRRFFTGGLGRLRGRVVGDRTPTVFEAWIGAHRTALRAAVIIVGVLVVALWPYPTALVAIVVALFVLLGLVIVELLGHSPRQPAPPT